MTSRGAMFAQAARGPVLLITLGTLFALQQAGILPFFRSWPLLIIVIGVMKLIERMLGGPVPHTPPAGTAAGFSSQPYTRMGQQYPPGSQAYPTQGSRPYTQEGSRPPEGQQR